MFDTSISTSLDSATVSERDVFGYASDSSYSPGAKKEPRAPVRRFANIVQYLVLIIRCHIVVSGPKGEEDVLRPASEARLHGIEGPIGVENVTPPGIVPFRSKMETIEEITSAS